MRGRRVAAKPRPRGLTQTQLAKLAHVSQQQIAKLEQPGENPTVETLAKVAAAAGMRLSIGYADAE